MPVLALESRPTDHVMFRAVIVQSTTSGGCGARGPFAFTNGCPALPFVHWCRPLFNRGSTISTQPLLTGIDELESSSPLVLHVAWPVCLDGGVRSSTRCLLPITKARGIAAPLIASGFRPVRTATGAAPSGSNHAPLTPYVSSASGAVS
jgi:hypothetical protein